MKLRNFAILGILLIIVGPMVKATSKAGILPEYACSENAADVDGHLCDRLGGIGNASASNATILQQQLESSESDENHLRIVITSNGDEDPPMLLGGTETEYIVQEEPILTKEKRQISSWSLSRGRSFFRSLSAVSSTPTLTKLTDIFGKMGSILAGIGDVLGIVTSLIDLVTDRTHEEIMNEFEKVHHAIANVRNDIKGLERHLDWRYTQVQYFSCVRTINTAMLLATRMGKQRTKSSQRRFIDHCRSQGLYQGLHKLVDGIHKKSWFSQNILMSFYYKSKGHRPNMIKLSARLTTLMMGGLSALMAYEKLLDGNQGVKEVVTEFQPMIVRARDAMVNTINVCTSNYNTNMQNDLDSIMNREASRKKNLPIAKMMLRFLQEKYDWFYFGVMVYDDVIGYNNHKLWGYINYKLHYPPNQKKCFIVTRVLKGSSFTYRSHKASMARYMRDFRSKDAGHAFDRIRAEFRRRGIKTRSLVVVRRFVDLWLTRDFRYPRVIWEVGRYMTKMATLA